MILRKHDKNESSLQISAGTMTFTLYLRTRFVPRDRRRLLLILYRNIKPTLKTLITLDSAHKTIRHSDDFVASGDWDGSRRPIDRSPVLRIGTPVQRLGLTIRMHRLKLGLRLVDLACLTGMSFTHLSLIERGLSKPRPSTLLKLESVLHRSLGRIQNRK